MINYPISHPGILAGLASAGHGSLVLIADGNYPVASAVGPRTQTVYLNLAPGVVDVTTVLELLVSSIPLAEAAIMSPDPGADVDRQFPGALPAEIPVRSLSRAAFYELARTDNLVLAIATADVRTYSNVLLRVGVWTSAQSANAANSIGVSSDRKAEL